MLTYDDTPEIRDIYRDRIPQQMNLHYRANQRKTGREVLYFSKALSTAIIDEQPVLSF
jgi:hypothetical protein